MLTLYSTSGCHLCEQAYSLISQLNLKEPLQVVDIAFDDALFSRYGVTIPVLAYSQQQLTNDGVKPFSNLENELFWPFNLDELQVWLKQNGINYYP
ncbi:glutaredoxin family protein [Vibrio aphrogenes]|uniref:glutaredoxin family protein n=1 Tax=Vibrio aphrogenes TaxID=1891186 RepID=UPI0013E0DE79|nr:glutaredoxin family protein [Vibrio aphrogenes]